ncbi:MAG: hypothetical protein BWY55_00357 [archaeon ADurb.Bin336]|nr:MAG: hypothetical protein BWY55_00357 [archaeon ADurb.Bin336]
MAKKVPTQRKKVSSEETSWPKIVLAVIAGIFLGWISLSFNISGLDSMVLLDFVIIALLACVLALLLDIRRTIISCSK